MEWPGTLPLAAEQEGRLLICEVLFVLVGLFFGAGFHRIAKVFPLLLLGAISLFGALALMWSVWDMAHSRSEFQVPVLVGLLAFRLPYGDAIGLITGNWTFLHR